MTDELVNLTDDELRAAVREGLLDDPANVNRIDSDTRRRMAKVRAELAPQQPTEPDFSQDSAPMRFAAGAARVLNPAPLAMALKDQGPLAVGGQMVQSQLDQFQKAKNAQTLPEQIGYTAAGMLPILGPAAAHAGETIASGDVAGGVGEGVGLLTPFAGKETAAAGVRALPDRVAQMADAASMARMTDVIAPKVGPNKLRLNQKAQDVAPQLARESGMGAFTREGLANKVTSKLDEAIANLDSASDARLASQQVKTGPILKAIDDQIANLTASPVEASAYPRATRDLPAPSRAQQVGGITGEVSDAQAFKSEPYGQSVEPAPNAGQLTALKRMRQEVANLGPVAPYESVRRIRQAWDQVAKVKYAPSMTQDYLAKQGEATGAMKGTGALRDALAQVDPQTAAANAEYSLRKAEHDVLEATRETEQARPHVGRSTLMRVGGAMAGGESGGPMGAAKGFVVGEIVDRLANSGVTTKVYTSRLLAQLADAIRHDRPWQAQSIQQKLIRAAAETSATSGSIAEGTTVSIPRVAEQPQEEQRTARR